MAHRRRGGVAPHVARRPAARRSSCCSTRRRRPLRPRGRVAAAGRDLQRHSHRAERAPGAGSPPSRRGGLARVARRTSGPLAQAAWTGGTLPVRAGRGRDRSHARRPQRDRSGRCRLLPAHAWSSPSSDSSVTLLEEVVSPDGAAGWFGGIVEIHALDGARVRYANLQRLGDGDVEHRGAAGGGRAGRQRDDAQRRGRVRVTKVGLDVQMAGKGGTSRLLGIAGRGRGPADRHQQPARTSPPRTPPPTCSTCPRSTTGPRRASTGSSRSSPRREQPAPTRSAATCSSRPRPARPRSRCSRS